MSNPINHDYAEGSEVKRVVELIEEALTSMCDVCRGSGSGMNVHNEPIQCPQCDGSGKVSGEDETVVLMACLSLSLMIQHPQIESDELAEGVLGASEWIALFLSSLDERKLERLPPNKVN